MVPFEPLVEIEPVTPREPVIKADPVKGNAGVEGAYDALTAYEAVKAYDAVPANCEVFEPVYELNEDVVTNDPVLMLPGIVNNDPVPSYISVPSV